MPVMTLLIGYKGVIYRLGGEMSGQGVRQGALDPVICSFASKAVGGSEHGLVDMDASKGLLTGMGRLLNEQH